MAQRISRMLRRRDTCRTDATLRSPHEQFQRTAMENRRSRPHLTAAWAWLLWGQKSPVDESKPLKKGASVLRMQMRP